MNTDWTQSKALAHTDCPEFQCYTRPPVKFMPNTVTFTHWSDFTLRNGLHVLGIIAVALILNRLLRLVTNLVIKRAASQTRAAQAR